MRIIEQNDRINEVDSMFLDIRDPFGFVPLKIHSRVSLEPRQAASEGAFSSYECSYKM
jgi:hypothetical protein